MGSTKWGGRRKWDRPNARDEIGNYEIGCDQFVAHGLLHLIIHGTGNIKNTETLFHFQESSRSSTVTLIMFIFCEPDLSLSV